MGYRNEGNNKEEQGRRGQEEWDRMKGTGRGTGMKETIRNSQEGKDQEGSSMNTVLGWDHLDKHCIMYIR